MSRPAPLNALIAVALVAAGTLLDPAPAAARRFGGGHSSGMSRSISTHSTAPSHITPHSASAHSASPTDRPPYPIEYAPLAPSRPSTHDNHHWPDAASAVLARSRIEAANLEAARNRQATRQRDEAYARQHASPGAAPAAEAPPFSSGTATLMDGGHPSRSGNVPAENISRPADPRFARLTDRAPQPSSSCEFKPVMSDADYLACGATPPQFAPPR